MAGTDQDGITHGVGYQIYAAQQERPQEDFAERSVGLHDVAHIRPADFEQYAGFVRTHPDQAPAARELVDLAGEHPPFEDAKGSFLIVRDTDDFDAASEHDKDAVASVSAVENHFIFLHPPLCAEWRKACNLRIIQFREHGVDLVGGLGHTSKITSLLEMFWATFTGCWPISAA